VYVAVSADENGKPLYAKMQVVEKVNKETTLEFAQKNIRQGCTITTDKLNVYPQLKESGYIHDPIVSVEDETNGRLKWVHTIISNAKSSITGTFHGLRKAHLQAYLDAFCYRFNRRYGGYFCKPTQRVSQRPIYFLANLGRSEQMVNIIWLIRPDSRISLLGWEHLDDSEPGSFNFASESVTDACQHYISIPVVVSNDTVPGDSCSPSWMESVTGRHRGDSGYAYLAVMESVNSNIRTCANTERQTIIEERTCRPELRGQAIHLA
jgi:transposase-like protein